MSYVPVYPARHRRRRDWRPAAAWAVVVLLLVLISALALRGRPVAASPEPVAGIGDVLHAGKHSAVVRGVLVLPGNEVLAAVQHVRGRHHGAAGYVVTGCPEAGEVIDTKTGTAREWARGESGIWTAIAVVACDSRAAVVEGA